MIDSAIDSPPTPTTPRQRLVLALNAELGALLATGDTEAARVAHEALGKLLGGTGGEPATVADLSVERAKRGAK